MKIREATPLPRRSLIDRMSEIKEISSVDFDQVPMS
jgi:hypothetical protein